MFGRLEELFTTDTRARFRIIAVSAVLFCVAGLLAEHSGTPSADAQVQAAALGAVVFAFQVLLYCLPSKAAVFHHPSPVRISRRLIVSTIFLVLAIVPTPLLEASVLERRLRRLTRSTLLSNGAATQVADILTMASNPVVGFGPSTLADARKTISSTLLDGATQGSVAAAEALQRYGSATIAARARADKNLAQALKLFVEGNEQSSRGTSRKPIVRSDIDGALADFGEALDLAGVDSPITPNILLSRAVTYLAIGEDANAFADAREAARLGALDLNTIFYVEGVALAKNAKNPDDLRRAVLLLTRSLQFNGPMSESIAYRVVLFTVRARAFYELKEFGKSMEDARQALAVVPISDHMAQTLYKQIILCLLQLGDYDRALGESMEFDRTIGGPESAVVHEILSSNRDDPARAISLITAML